MRSQKEQKIRAFFSASLFKNKNKKKKKNTRNSSKRSGCGTRPATHFPFACLIAKVNYCRGSALQTASRRLSLPSVKKGAGD